MTPSASARRGFSIDATVLFETVTLADPNMKMGGAVLSGGCPPFSKAHCNRNREWAEVVKFSGARPD